MIRVLLVNDRIMAGKLEGDLSSDRELALDDSQDVTSDALTSVIELCGLNEPLVVTVDGHPKYEIEVRDYTGEPGAPQIINKSPSGVQ